MPEKKVTYEELLGIKKPTGEKDLVNLSKSPSVATEELIPSRMGTDSKLVGRITIPETIRTGSKTIADTSVLRAFHLFMTGKHDRGPKGDLINKLIIELKKL